MLEKKCVFCWCSVEWFVHLSLSLYGLSISHFLCARKSHKKSPQVWKNTKRPIYVIKIFHIFLQKMLIKIQKNQNKVYSLLVSVLYSKVINLFLVGTESLSSLLEIFGGTTSVSWFMFMVLYDLFATLSFAMFP